MSRRVADFGHPHRAARDVRWRGGIIPPGGRSTRRTRHRHDQSHYARLVSCRRYATSVILSYDARDARRASALRSSRCASSQLKGWMAAFLGPHRWRVHPVAHSTDDQIEAERSVEAAVQHPLQVIDGGGGEPLRQRRSRSSSSAVSRGVSSRCLPGRGVPSPSGAPGTRVWVATGSCSWSRRAECLASLRAPERRGPCRPIMGQVR